MIPSKNSHAHSYSFSKFNQSISAARLYYKQGAFAKAFDTYIVTQKNTGFELDKEDIFTTGQCLVNMLEQAYEDEQFSKSGLDYLCQEIDKLQTMHVNENSIAFIKVIAQPLYECIQHDLEKNKTNTRILGAYRMIIDRIAQSCLIPIDLENCINKHEQLLCDEIMQKIRKWYEQQLYTLASIHAEKEIALILVYYPALGDKILNETIELFKKHDQCPQRLLDKFSENTKLARKNISSGVH